ncbi:sensor histidine kinase [Bradyrhizobium sp. USDA 223]|uniref:sensor histidine kinase n=1 Tax=Bradyrhizobium sp. USDA 223 TaxID=3156306 RepID=UPI0038396691
MNDSLCGDSERLTRHLLEYRIGPEDRVVSFRFAARTMLELGKELISSDEVALYELIKNGIDAGSPRVEINARVVLPYAAYSAALESLDGGIQTRRVLTELRAKILPGTPTERTAAFFATLEPAVGRATRFRAALKAAYRRHNWIEISDIGEGMSMETLSDVYLTVGTRSRRRMNVAGASYLGDKGVGRLSAMRLGNYLEVKTSTAEERRWNKLRIDWTLFSHESEQSVGDIDIKPKLGPVKDDKAEQGTVIRVSDLTVEWNETTFAALFQGKIARMIDPFVPGRGNKLLRVRFNGSRIAIPSIPAELLKQAHATCFASLTFEDNEPVLEGTVSYPYRNASRPIAQRGAEVYSITQNVFRRRGKRGHAATLAAPIRPKALKDLGPVDVKVYWYNRLVVEKIPDLTNTVKETRDEIRRWSGGPMLFRYGFRILPYGEPDDDWVELDRNAFGQSGFKLNRQQVIGRVSVKSAHTALSEQTNREGLVASDAQQALRTIVMWLLHGELRELINTADKAEQINRREAEKLSFDFRETQGSVTEALETLRRQTTPQQREAVDRLGKLVKLMGDQCEKLVGKTNEAIDDSVEEREKFVHLAGIGLMTEFIFHELDRAVGHTMELLANVDGLSQKAALEALEIQLHTLQKRVAAFDELAGEKRQTKSTFDLGDTVRLVLENHQNQFRRHSIKINFDFEGKYKINAVKGMVIQILENLIANSVYWLKQQKNLEPKFKPEITIDIDPESKAMTVEDNGPGIDPRRRETIFEPFVTSKPPGQGRGLGLYISKELARYHDWQLYLDDRVGRVRLGRMNMFVLDMDDERK